MREMLTTGEVCELLGVKPWHVRYALDAGKARRPTKLPSGVFLWRHAEIRELARALGVDCPKLSDEGPAARRVAGAESCPRIVQDSAE